MLVIITELRRATPESWQMGAVERVAARILNHFMPRFFSGGCERTALQIGGRWVRFGPQIIFGPWIIFDHTAPGARGLARRGFAKAALRDVP